MNIKRKIECSSWTKRSKVIVEINKVNNKICEQLISKNLGIKVFEENKSKMGLNNVQIISLNFSDVHHATVPLQM